MRGTKRNGRRRGRKQQRRNTRKRGIQRAGFYPSVMAGVQNATLLTPVALRLGLSMWDRANSTRGVRKEHQTRSWAASLDRASGARPKNPGGARRRKTRRRKRV